MNLSIIPTGPLDHMQNVCPIHAQLMDMLVYKHTYYIHACMHARVNILSQTKLHFGTSSNIMANKI